MKRKHKQYSRPKKPFDKVRIEEEREIAKRYGLKNKREIWKAEAKIEVIRRQAKRLITDSPEEQQVLINKLNKQGFKVEKIADILGLTKEDLLKRRLQSVLVKKGMARTPSHARQLITHKHVLINGNIVNVPSYIVKLSEENKIEIKAKKMEKAKKSEEKKEEKG